MKNLLNFNQLNEAIDPAINGLKNLSGEISAIIENRSFYFPNIPTEIKEELKLLKKKIDEYDKSKISKKLKTIEGDFLIMKNIKKTIEDATGYKWSISDKKDDLMDLEVFSPDDISDTFGVLVKENDIKIYILTRNTNDRSALSRIEIAALPGHFYATWMTDRVNGDTGKILKNSELKNYFEKQV